MLDVSALVAGFSCWLTRNKLEMSGPRETMRAHLRRYAECVGLRVGARQARHVLRALERGLTEKTRASG